MSTPRFSSRDVRAYYDANTGAFVRHGQGGAWGAIHRAVWAPAVTSREQAFRYVEDLILREIDALAADHRPTVLDLGCGVGASLTYLAEKRPLRGIGLTLSPVQAALGERRVAALGMTDRVHILEGDYTDIPDPISGVDVAYAIESFVHGPSPERFFAEAARVLRRDGRLIVCDDARISTSPDAARTIEQFERGWHVNALLSPAEWNDSAARAGLTHLGTTDLSPYLELGRPRDRAIALLARVVGHLPAVPRRLSPLVGGAALQRGLANHWIAYQFAVFRRL